VPSGYVLMMNRPSASSMISTFMGFLGMANERQYGREVPCVYLWRDGETTSAPLRLRQTSSSRWMAGPSRSWTSKCWPISKYPASGRLPIPAKRDEFSLSWLQGLGLLPRPRSSRREGWGRDYFRADGERSISRSAPSGSSWPIAVHLKRKS
jgi:hypothetical protein